MKKVLIPNIKYEYVEAEGSQRKTRQVYLKLFAYARHNLLLRAKVLGLSQIYSSWNLIKIVNPRKIEIVNSVTRREVGVIYV